MSLRFRRSIKLFPGVKINIGKNSISTSIGVRGAHLTFGKSGTYIGTGIPGTGLSQRTKLSGPSHANPVEHLESSTQNPEITNQGKHYKLGVTFWLIFGTIILALFQLPKVLAIYWVILLAYVIIRSIIRSAKKRSSTSVINDSENNLEK